MERTTFNLEVQMLPDMRALRLVGEIFYGHCEIILFYLLMMYFQQVSYLILVVCLVQGSNLFTDHPYGFIHNFIITITVVIIVVLSRQLSTRH